jgi:hypothetical protein
LKGLRQDHLGQAQTWISVLQDMMDKLPGHYRKALELPQFSIGAPDLYSQMDAVGISMGTDREIKTPVITYNARSGLPELTVNFNNMFSDTEVGAKALICLEHLCYQQAHVLHLRPDNLVIIDNRTTAHTRNGYSPRYDGQDRWFQRVNVQDQLWQENVIVSEDFSRILGMSPDQAARLLSWLKESSFVDNEGRLTDAFSKTEQAMRKSITEKSTIPVTAFFDFPSEYRSRCLEILDCLLTKGPVFPSRIV